MATHTDPVCGEKIDDQMPRHMPPTRGIVATSAPRAAKRSLINTRSNARAKTQEVESRMAAVCGKRNRMSICRSW
jgi:hypothetical protein